jgi:hypothetical protein
MKTSPTDLHVTGPFQTISGDPSSALNAYNTTLLVDGAFAYVVEDKGIWFLDKLSSSTPDGSSVVMPAVGPGRWVRVGGLPTPP